MTVSGQKQVPDLRKPILFTSVLRRRLVDNVEDPPAPNPLLANEQASLGSLAGSDKNRVVLPEVEMLINPKTIRWEQPKRITKRDTREGSVFFHFTNDRGENNDILTLHFNGSTGNIDMRGSEDTGAFRKWLIWHNLYLLTREPILLPDGAENLVTITYTSPLWAAPVDFIGFFEQVLEFTEDAGKPHSREYSFSFKVVESSPELSDVLLNMTTVVTSTGGRAATVAPGETVVNNFANSPPFDADLQGPGIIGILG